MLYLNAKKDYNVNEVSAVKSSVIEIHTACAELGLAIVTAVEYAIEKITNSEGKQLGIYTVSTPLHLILRKFMAKELHEVQ